MPRRGLTAAGLWLLAVAVISATVWLVIGRVGQVGSGGVLANPAVDAAGSGTAPADSGGALGPTGTPGVGGPTDASSTPGSTAPPTDGAPTASGVVTQRPRTTAKPPAQPPATVRAPQPRPTTAAAPRAISRSFSTDGGAVSVTCRGTILTLDSVVPRDGWSFERSREGGEAEVKFTLGEREVEVKVRCIGGTPTASD